MSGGEVLTESEMRERIRVAAERRGSQRKLAEKIGVTEAFLSDVIRGHRDIGKKVISELGYERQYIYRRRKVGTGC